MTQGNVLMPRYHTRAWTLINLHLPQQEPKVPAAQGKTASWKAMELKERDMHVLIRSMPRWGDIC